MNHILRMTVMPWSLLSGMGNWSYAVITDWIDPRNGSSIPGSAAPAIFYNASDAKAHARKECSAWPYRAEACFLNDAGKYLPLESRG